VEDFPLELNNVFSTVTKKRSRFFTRFPEDTAMTDLWKLFAQFGHVGEVVVPSKVDWWGEAIWFVRFKGVSKVEGLESKMEECRQKVNKARFGLEDN